MPVFQYDRGPSQLSTRGLRSSLLACLPFLPYRTPPQMNADVDFVTRLTSFVSGQDGWRMDDGGKIYCGPIDTAVRVR